MNQDADIELKSKKVQKIIGKISSRITRFGTTIVFICFLMLTSVGYFYQFDNTINTISRVCKSNDCISYSINLPVNKINKVRYGQKVQLIFHNSQKLNVSVGYIDTTKHINSSAIYYIIRGDVTNSEFKFDESVEASAIIYTGKVNAIEYILNH